MNRKNSDEMELSIQDILDVLWTHKWIIVAIITVCIAASYLYYAYFTKPQYVANGVLYVSSQAIERTYDEISKSDIESSRTLSTTYIEILKGRSFLKNVSDNISGRYSWKQIRGMLSIKSINATELIAVEVTATDPNDAYEIAKNIIENAPDKLLAVFKRGKVEIIDEVEMPTNPISSNIQKVLVTGFLLGIAIGVIVSFLIRFFDTKIRKSDDLIRRYDISILGEIIE